MLCDVLGKMPRPWVPVGFRLPIYKQMHGLAHRVIQALVKLLSGCFVWHGLSRNVTLWARTCVACRRAKVHLYTDSGVEKVPVPDTRFGTLHVNLVGPFAPLGGVHPPPYCCRPIFQVAGGFPAGRYYQARGGQVGHLRVDCPF